MTYYLYARFYQTMKEGNFTKFRENFSFQKEFFRDLKAWVILMSLNILLLDLQQQWIRFFQCHAFNIIDFLTMVLPFDKTHGHKKNNLHLFEAFWCSLFFPCWLISCRQGKRCKHASNAWGQFLRKCVSIFGLTEIFLHFLTINVHKCKLLSTINLFL